MIIVRIYGNVRTRSRQPDPLVVYVRRVEDDCRLEVD